MKTLHLLPQLLSKDADPAFAFVPAISQALESMHGFFVETPKEARLFLKHFDFARLKTLPMHTYNKRNRGEAKELLEEMSEGEHWGVLSDAGLCCLADPGAELVKEARNQGIEIIAYPGPSSVILALMYSGFSGQKFCFEGYFPRKVTPKLNVHQVTQIFIQTPYKNIVTMRDLLNVLRSKDEISVSVDLTGATQEVHTYTVEQWKTRNTLIESLHKRPCVFVLK